jgi:hypothetical protein
VTALQSQMLLFCPLWSLLLLKVEVKVVMQMKIM